MPSSTPRMARAMAAAAHNPGIAKKLGIPQAVAKEFNQADKGTGLIRKAMQHGTRQDQGRKAR